MKDDIDVFVLAGVTACLTELAERRKSEVLGTIAAMPNTDAKLEVASDSRFRQMVDTLVLLNERLQKAKNETA